MTKLQAENTIKDKYTKLVGKTFTHVYSGKKLILKSVLPATDNSKFYIVFKFDDSFSDQNGNQWDSCNQNNFAENFK